MVLNVNNSASLDPIKHALEQYMFEEQPDASQRLQAIETVNAAGDALNRYVEDWTEQRFANGQIPAILGGDHSVPFGAMVAAAKRYPGLGVLHIDASTG